MSATELRKAQRELRNLSQAPMAEAVDLAPDESLRYDPATGRLAVQRGHPPPPGLPDGDGEMMGGGRKKKKKNSRKYRFGGKAMTRRKKHRKGVSKRLRKQQTKARRNRTKRGGDRVFKNYKRHELYLSHLINVGGETVSERDFVATHNGREINNLMSAMRYYLNHKASGDEEKKKAAAAFFNTAHRAQEEANEQSQKVLNIIREIDPSIYN